MAGGSARKVVLIACVVLIVRLVVGPFSQRATKVGQELTGRNIKMNVRLANLIPDGWFGTWEAFSPRGVRASQEMFTQSNMTTLDRYGYYCPSNGTCTGTVAGAGFHFTCKSNTTSMNLLDRGNENKTLFSIGFQMVVTGEVPILRINTEHVSLITGNCTGVLMSQECDLITGTVNYPIIIENNIIRPEVDSYLDNPEVLSNTTTPGDIFPATIVDRQNPVGALYGVFSGTKLFQSKALLRTNADGSVRQLPQSDDGNNIYWSNIYIDTRDVMSNSTHQGQAKDKCPVVFLSPMRPMLRYIFDFTFRSAYAIAAAEDSDKHHQRFSARYKGSELFYKTDFVWLAVTVSSMVLGIIATLALLWGYWELCHYVTFSPVETGKALGAPVLQGAVPEQEADRIVKRIGNERVRYSGDELMVWNGQVYVTGVDAEKHMSSSGLGDAGESDIEMQRSLRRRGESKVVEGFEHDHGYRTVKLDEDGADGGHAVRG